MSDTDPKPSVEQTADPAEGAVVHLPVLVHSGKVDELKRLAQSDREGQAAAPTTSAAAAAAPPPAGAETSTAPASAPAPADSPSRSIQRKLLEGKVIEAIRQVYDPEI